MREMGRKRRKKRSARDACHKVERAVLNEAVRAAFWGKVTQNV